MKKVCFDEGNINNVKSGALIKLLKLLDLKTERKRRWDQRKRMKKKK
jgi:hypothetical protein